MNLKEFLKPTLIKILVTIILIFSSLLYKRPNYCFDANCYPRGFPLPFVDEMISGLRVAHEKYIGYFLIDFVVYFLLSCVIIHIFNKLKNKLINYGLVGIRTRSFRPFH